ncbi:hypothetical protein P278_07340 [Zhouia amylolytica AD3]|uniref:DUF6705 domain-containing protein n=2 Tax=Zhouia amylolytica TaxID=376730 RepID=W2UQE3_9FLAO|nr:hypothetical protein P278_07340 [Zhouia amylolytica AD3]
MKSTQNSELNKYLGTWVYSNGNETFKIKLLPSRFPLPDGTYENMIQGYHYYEKDGVIVESSFDKITTVINDHIYPGSTMGGGIIEHVLSIHIKDISKDKYGIVTLKLIEENKIKWSLRENSNETVTVGMSVKRSEQGFSMPSEMILEKSTNN